MELKNNGKGIISIELTQNDLLIKSFGNVCDRCGEDISENSVYIPVLNSVFCPKCSESFLRRHRLPLEDEKYQDRNLSMYFPELVK